MFQRARNSIIKNRNRYKGLSSGLINGVSLFHDSKIAQRESVILPKECYTINSSGSANMNLLQELNEPTSDSEPNAINLHYKTIAFSDYLGGNEHHTHKVLFGNSKHKQGLKVESKIFIDLKVIRVKSGNGGNGCVSFARSAHSPVGPPDGGDGGKGGGIFVQATPNVTSLHKLKRSYEAKAGTPGSGSQLDGKNGDNVIIEVPVGTKIKWIPDPLLLRNFIKQEKHQLNKISLNINTTDDDCDQIQMFRQKSPPGEDWIFKERDKEYFYERQFFLDLDERVKELEVEMTYEELSRDIFPLDGIDFVQPSIKPKLLLEGGRGGMGNMHFITKDIRNPRFAKRGRDGITAYFILELKLLADIGLVGLPNVGKSTLLRTISKAKPRVGDWEFTTLQPTVGTIDNGIDKDPFTVADIPGIIKDASKNKGMGLDFLRHIERSKGLAFVISLDSKDPLSDLQLLIQEVGEKRMQNKNSLVIATKADLSKDSKAYDCLKEFVYTLGWKIVPVSAQKKENVDLCKALLAEMVF